MYYLRLDYYMGSCDREIIKIGRKKTTPFQKIIMAVLLDLDVAERRYNYHSALFQHRTVIYPLPNLSLKYRYLI